MVPVEMDGKTHWPPDRVRFAHAKVRGKVIAGLRKRDMRHGIPADGKVYKTGVDGSGNATFVIDPVKSSLKHSGAEARALIAEAWHEFCSSPLASDPYQPNMPPQIEHLRKHAGLESRPAVAESSPEEVCPKCGGVRFGRGYRHEVDCSMSAINRRKKSDA